MYGNKPMRRHRHDCNECYWMGRKGKDDVYLHIRKDSATVIFRYGSEPEEYTTLLTMTGK